MLYGNANKIYYSETTLASVSRDIFELVQRFSDQPEVTSMYSYQLCVRVIKEQCTIEENLDGKPGEVSVKSSKEIPSNSLQNPSDPMRAMVVMKTVKLQRLWE